MACPARGDMAMATRASGGFGRHPFFLRMAFALSMFIMFGFLQFAARGFVDYRAVPVWFHLHAMAMTSWLGLTCVQAWLADRGDLALHRRLGWISLGLVPAVWLLAQAAVVSALRGGLVPPFFTPPFFLALVPTEATLFVGLVALAIARRRQTDWHARLLVGALVLVMEPALGRLLPMPLLGGDLGEGMALVVQLGVLGLVMRHDRGATGSVHPATWVAAGAVIFAHGLVMLLARVPAMAAAAAAIAAG